MKIKSLALILIAISVILSCNKENKVKLVEKSFEHEITENEAISFTFSHAMVPDSLTGKWAGNNLLEFSPQVKGRINWQTARKLVFIAEGGFRPSTNYTCTFKNKVFANVKDMDYTDDKEFQFHTTFLALTNINSFWKATDKTGTKPVLHIELEFNQQVDPTTVADFIDLELDKDGKNFELISKEKGKKVEIAITDINVEDKEMGAKVMIKKGLISSFGAEETDKPITSKLDIPSPFKLTITNVQTKHDGALGTVTIYTTQKVDVASLKKHLRITPSVKYDIEIETNQVLLKSESFSANAKYELNIAKGLKGSVGGTLKYDYSQPVTFGEVRPSIKFASQKGFYVSGKGSRNIEVSIVNVEKVNLKVVKLYENNILAFLKTYQFNRSSDYDDYYYDDYYYYGGYSDPESLGDVIFEQEIETSTLPQQGSNSILSVDFEDKLAGNKGIYFIQITSDEEYWLRAKKVVSVSDIGLITKKGKNSIAVFANSIKEATPLSEVEITFIGQNNQVTHTATTDANGVAVYNFDQLKAPGFETALITAKQGTDYNIIPLSETRINTSRYDVGGYYENPSGLMAFIYGDRDLYRPGEKVNMSAIIRDYQWQVPASLPMVLKVHAPNGKVYKTIKKVLNNQGAFETSFTIPASAQTGTYSCNLYTSNNVVIGYYNVKIEEFMPDRIKVDVKTDQTEYKPGKWVDVNIHADNFFGPPAANRNYQIEYSTKKIIFYPKTNQGYNYSLNGDDTYFSNVIRDSKTDDNGDAMESFEIPASYKDMGILQSDIFTTVFDETGRPVNRLNRIKIYTQDVFFGIRATDYYVKTGQPARFDLIAVDKNGNALAGIPAKVELIKHEYKTVLSKSGSYFRYRSEKVERKLESKTIDINEASTFFSFIPELSGRYELRIKPTDGHTYVSAMMYAYGWGSTSYSSFEVNNEGQIEMELEKNKYNVGETAKVLCKTPFSGKLLITVEGNKVIDHFYVDTDKRAAEFSIDIKESHLPNVYISATLFKPHEKTDVPLTVAHGFAPIKVDNPDYKIPVSIEAVEKSRSNTRQNIKVKAAPNSPVTIAIVDEGILQVSGYGAPDPYNYFYQKRALQVSTSNVYPYLFPELGMVRSSTGAGMGAMAKRLNPMQNKRVKLVSFWSGILTTNGKGEAEYTVDIPQFSGDLRIVAVNYQGQKFGTGKSNMKVADPLVTSVGLPRFLSPGDTAVVPVILTNTTDVEMKCKASLKISGPVKIVGGAKQQTDVPANREGKLMYKIYAEKAIGQAEVTVSIAANGEEFENKTELPVRPASPLQKRSGSGVIEAGKIAQVDLETSDFIDKSLKTKLIVSNNPLVEFSKSLDYLVRYPYGCVEQTVSAAFPQLYFSDLVGTIYKNNRASGDAIHNVQVALDKLKLMQLYNGGLTYWPGGGYESWWGSAYAAHFVIEAEKAGYEVDEAFKKQLLNYLKSKLRSRETIRYYYNRDQMRMIAPKTVPYSLYVLCLDGEKPMALLNYYHRNLDQLSLDGRYLLAGAYALTGDKNKYKEIVPGAFEGEKSNKSFGGSFYSYIRDEAVALNVLLEIDPENDQVGLMGRHISNALKTERYLNTQERSFGFLAMGKIARNAIQSDIKATVEVNGKSVGQMENSTLILNTDKLKGDIQITTKGSGKAYYFYESEGISTDGSYKETDNYISVRKTLYNRQGSVISENGTVQQNDLILIGISVRGLTNTLVENVAITDMLPAGFEIENPRLTELPPGMSWPEKKSSPQYMDVRDDRIIMFTSVTSSRKTFFYLVRAVSPGTYQMGPVGADAMYNGEYHSYNGAGVVTIGNE